MLEGHSSIRAEYGGIRSRTFLPCYEHDVPGLLAIFRKLLVRFRTHGFLNPNQPPSVFRSTTATYLYYTQFVPLFNPKRKSLSVTAIVNLSAQ